VLVIHFGTPSRQNDCARRQPLGPGSPRSGPLLRHEQRPLGAFGLRNGPTANGLTACGMRFAYPLRGFGSSPLRHCGCTHAPTPTGDYAPSLRSPWRAAFAPKPAIASCEAKNRERHCSATDASRCCSSRGSPLGLAFAQGRGGLGTTDRPAIRPDRCPGASWLNWSRFNRYASRYLPSARKLNPYPEQRFSASRP